MKKEEKKILSYRPSPVKGKAWQHCTFEQRFKASFVINSKTGCWEWIGCNEDQYGSITFEGFWIGTHRAAWLNFKGEIPDGLFVLHKCDIRRCVNYKKHLYLGTKKAK